VGFVGFFFLSFVGVQARPDEITAYAEYTQWIAAALVVLILFSSVAAWQARRNGITSIASLAIGFYLTSMIAGTGHETLGRAVSGVDLANRVRNVIPPERWAPTLNDFIERWKAQPNAYALMVPSQYAELERLGLPMEIVDRDSRRIIVKHPTGVVNPALPR
jgi:hypothetical protein